jgi:hypothetical protein
MYNGTSTPVAERYTLSDYAGNSNLTASDMVCEFTFLPGGTGINGALRGSISGGGCQGQSTRGATGVSSLLGKTGSGCRETYLYKYKANVGGSSGGGGTCGGTSGDLGIEVAFRFDIFSANGTGTPRPTSDLEITIRRDMNAGSEIFYQFRTGALPQCS